MSVKPQSISDLAEYWDELTPTQQQFMIQRAKALAGYNKMKADGVWKGEELHKTIPKTDNEPIKE